MLPVSKSLAAKEPFEGMPGVSKVLEGACARRFRHHLVRSDNDLVDELGEWSPILRRYLPFFDKMGAGRKDTMRSLAIKKVVL